MKKENNCIEKELNKVILRSDKSHVNIFSLYYPQMKNQTNGRERGAQGRLHQKEKKV